MGCIIIGIAGGTGSGKTTFTNRIKNEFGDLVTVLYHDNYYKRRDDISMNERKLINYDHPDAIDTNLLITHIKSLKAGMSVEVPLYDFNVHNRKAEMVTIKPHKIIIVEGILIFHDETLRNLFDIKLFMDLDADIRVLRRAKRDTEERGRNLQNIVSQYINTVKPMHELYVEPTKRFADIIINGQNNDVFFRIIKNYISNFI